MAEVAKTDDLQEVLKPFYQRACEAEERLSRLEAELANKSDGSNAGSDKLSSIVKDFESKLETKEADLESERKKGQALSAENDKLKYRITHLVRALKEADSRQN